jgi:hypothetical protein
MGSKYTSNSASGFNATPPPDDGSVSEANKLKWSYIKTKLADPVKTLADDINTDLVTALDTSARAISASDSSAATDHWRTIQVNTASVTVTLADAATMAAGYIVTVANQSSGEITVALATAANTIDAVTNTTVTIPAKEARTYIVNVALTGYVTKSARSIRKITLGTEQASTSGTSIDFTGIPAGVRRIKIMFEGVSTNGTDEYLVQLGDGAIENTGYTSTCILLAAVPATDSSTAGFIVTESVGAASTAHGVITLCLKDATGFTWVSEGKLTNGTTSIHVSAGSKSLSSELDRVRVTTTGGTNTFDAGSINISYEF